MAKRKIPSATSMQDAANADDSLQGYAAMNALDEHDEIARLAYQYYEERQGQPGSAEEDWLRAEADVRRRTERPFASSAGG